MKEIDLKKTLDNTQGRITTQFVAYQTIRGVDTVRKWVRGNKIPSTVVPRLLEIFNNNEVKIFYKED